jgi:hypothetical protein
MRKSSVAVGVILLTLSAGAGASAQTMERVVYFPDSIAEKEDHVVRLNGGSSWVLASRTAALVAADVTIVIRDVVVEGRTIRAAWLFAGAEEIPAKHVEGVYPTNQALLTRVVASEDQGTKLRLADGTVLVLPGYNKYISNRWVPPYKALLTDNRLSLYNLKEGRRVGVQPAKK